MRKARLVAAMVSGTLLVVLVVVVVGFLVIPLLFPCSAQERSVINDFPHYGNVKPKVIGNAEAGGCGVLYDTDASDQRVAKYYMEQLRAHGWQAQQSVAAVAAIIAARVVNNTMRLISATFPEGRDSSAPP
jgi:hypothetical protein